MQIALERENEGIRIRFRDMRNRDYYYDGVRGIKLCADFDWGARLALVCSAQEKVIRFDSISLAGSRFCTTEMIDLYVLGPPAPHGTTTSIRNMGLGMWNLYWQGRVRPSEISEVLGGVAWAAKRANGIATSLDSEIWWPVFKSGKIFGDESTPEWEEKRRTLNLVYPMNEGRSLGMAAYLRPGSHIGVIPWKR